MQNPYSKYQNQGPGKKRGKSMKKRGPKKDLAKRQDKLPMIMIVACGLGLTLSLYVFAYADEVLELASRIQVDFSSARANEKEKAADQKEKKEEKDAALPVGTVSSLGSKGRKLTMKNASVYEALKEKRNELEKKERDLARLEEDLQNQKVEIEKQLKELEKMRREISSVLDKKVKADQSSVDKLVGMYSGMKPQNAANILTQINEELAIKVLGKMKKPNAAAILNFMEPKKAQELSERFAGLKQ